MMLTNPPKALIVLVALIIIGVLLAMGRIDESEGMGIIGLIVGYGIGNGIAAKQGENVDPIIGTKRRNRRSDDEAP
jgi:hypothetical protein